METIPRTRVVVGILRTNYPKLLVRSKAIYNAMSSASAEFPAPVPAMPTFGTQVQAFADAQEALTTRAVGTAQSRNAKAAVVYTSLDSLRTYVQGLCDASPEQAHTLIASAAMSVARAPAVHKPILAVKQAVSSGVADLFVNRAVLAGATRKGVLFNWEYSLDGGKTWVAAGATTFAKTTIVGLPPLTAVEFRVASTVGGVAGAWSQEVGLLMR